MLHEDKLGAEFFKELAEIDERITARVAAGRCPRCGGPLHRGDYQRKPRGGWLADTPDAAAVRYSLCCGRRGCRKRALPPSVRFLGRRVYWEAVVILATMRLLLGGVIEHAQRATGVPRRTLLRWATWWRGEFPSSPMWTVMRGRFVPPPPDETALPTSLLERLATEMKASAVSASDVLVGTARLLAPMTTGSVPDGARFVWAAARP